MFLTGEKVRVSVAGQAISAMVVEHLTYDHYKFHFGELVVVTTEAGEKLAVEPSKVEHIGRGFQVGQMVGLYGQVKGEIVAVGPATVKVKVLEVYGRKTNIGTIRQVKKEAIEVL
jgi:hypothetical protein